VPTGKRAYDPRYDMPPGKGFTSYDVYQFTVYDYETYDAYQAAVAAKDNVAARAVARFELSGDVQLKEKGAHHYNPSIIGTTARAVQVRLLDSGTRRTQKFGLKVEDIGSPAGPRGRLGRLRYDDPSRKVCGKRGCNAAGIRIHLGGPAYSTGCLTTPDRSFIAKRPDPKNPDRFIREPSVKKVGGQFITTEQFAAFEDYIARSLNLQAAAPTAVLVLPGRDVKYPSYEYSANAYSYWRTELGPDVASSDVSKEESGTSERGERPTKPVLMIIEQAR
jgi:hypothetical protein